MPFFQYPEKCLGLPDDPSTNPVNVEEQFDPLFFGTLDTMLCLYTLSYKLVNSPI